MAAYFYRTSLADQEFNEHILMSEVLVPIAMMLVLSIIHSQIGATHLGPIRDLARSRSRRVKRTKRRIATSTRSRSTMCSDSKSSLDTGPDKVVHSSEMSTNKHSKRVRLRRCSSEDVRRHGVVWDSSTNKWNESLPDPEDTQSGNVRPRVRLQVEPSDEQPAQQCEASPLDDDGFESLNGNGSSENGDEVSEEGVIIERRSSDPGKPSQDRSCLNWNQTKEDRSALNWHHSLNESQLKEDLDNLGSMEKPACDLPVTNSLSDGSLGNRKEASLSLRNGVEVEKSSLWPEEVEAKEEEVRAGTPLRNAWVKEVLSGRKHEETETDASDTETRPSTCRQQGCLLVRRGGSQTLQLQTTSLVESSYNSSCDSEDPAGAAGPLLTEGTTSTGEWIGVTTNSEECSYSSDLEHSDSQLANREGLELNDHPFAWEFELSPSMILSPSCAASDRVSCTMWESRDVKKAELSVLDISSAIIARVETMPDNADYFYGGVVASVLLALLPSLCRLMAVDLGGAAVSMTELDSIDSLPAQVTATLGLFINRALGATLWQRVVVLIALCERCILAMLFFFLLAVAERTFKQRFLYAKLFSHLTSFRRARKSELPHFRLNKVRNIKTWLSVRSYLKKRGPQRSVDVIVSAAFLITLLLLSFLSVEYLKVSVDEQDSSRFHSQYNLEAMIWCLVLGLFLLRFMTLGTKINRKYRNLSVLITEQDSSFDMMVNFGISN